MNKVIVNLRGYYSKQINLQNYTQTDVGHLLAKQCKFYAFFYYTETSVNANAYQLGFIVEFI